MVHAPSPSPPILAGKTPLDLVEEMLSSKGRGGGCRRSCHVEFSRTLVIMRQASQFLSVFDFDEKLDMVTALFAEKLDRLIWHLNPETKGKEFNPADPTTPMMTAVAT